MAVSRCKSDNQHRATKLEANHIRNGIVAPLAQGDDVQPAVLRAIGYGDR